MRDGDDEEETLVRPEAPSDLADVTTPAADPLAAGQVVSGWPLSEGPPASSARDDFHAADFRTRYADSAMSLAEQFALLVGGKPLRGRVQYRIELSTPDGPSTGGGAQVLQHMKLVPADGGPTLVAGSVHLIERAAEVRTLDFLDAEHERRFARSSLTPPPSPSARIERGAYDEVVDRIRTFCVEQDFKVTTLTAPRGAPTVVRARPEAPGGSALGRFALPLALLAFAGTIVLVFLSLRSP